MFSRLLIGCFLYSTLLMVVLPVIAQEPAPAQPTIREVVFRNIEAVPADMRQQVETVAAGVIGQPSSPEVIEQLRTQLRELGIFANVTFTSEPVADGVRLVGDLALNPVIAGIEFDGNTVLTDEQLREVIKLQPGMILNQRQVVQDALAIEQAYAKRGYTLVNITDIIITPENTLRFVIAEARISEVRIEGNRRTRTELIRRAITVQAGDIFNIQAIRESIANLQRLNVFADVAVNTEPGTTPGTVSVIFTVQERRTGLVTFGGSYNQVGGVSAYINLTEGNLFGRAQQLSLILQLGARQVYQLSYFKPIISREDTSVGVNLYSREFPHQVFTQDTSFDYTEKRTGGNVALGRIIGPATRGFLTIRADHIRSRPDGDNPVPEIVLEDVDVRSLMPAVVYDTRSSPVYPVGGTYLAGSVQVAGLLGGADFTQFSTEARRYWRVRGRAPDVLDEIPASEERLPWVLASRLLVGASFGSPPFLDQFRLGGVEGLGLRGFPEDRFPGKHVVLSSNELRVPFTTSLQGVAFVDVGDAWGGVFADEFGDPDFTLHVGYGLGIRVQTPIGPLRLDYGLNNEGGSEFHFGIGPTF